MQRVNSTKRSREDIQSPSRPSKRNSLFPKHTTSPTLTPEKGSPLLTTPPNTPKKKSSRSSLTQKSKLITSFKKAFSAPSRTLQSPVSENDTTPSSPQYSHVPSPQLESSPFRLYFPESAAFAQAGPSVEESLCRTLTFEDVNNQLSNLHIDLESHAIFHIPEILTKIISYVDEFTSVPCEESPIRRRPLSYQHALLIYKDEQRAQQVWQDSLKCTMDQDGNPVTNFRGEVNSLYSCFLVNKLWYRVTCEVASTKLFFSDDLKWKSFIKTTKHRQLTRTRSNTRLFIMHKLSKAEQFEVDDISESISGSLEWIEMYICPRVLPTPSMLTGSLLKKLVLPGSKVVDDTFLKLVAKQCPRLEHLDLRACGRVSDAGITHLASRCTGLLSLNLGRHSHTSRITDVSLHALSIYTHLETLGVAGCAITDRGLWEIALRCSDSITRLSLNNCVQLTNNSLPMIFERGYLQNLTVLEIRHVLGLTNVVPLVHYKRNREFISEPVLIEGCEVLEYRMRTEEWRQEMMSSAKMLNDIQGWCNTEDDGDVPLTKLFKPLRAVSI